MYPWLPQTTTDAKATAVITAATALPGTTLLMLLPKMEQPNIHIQLISPLPMELPTIPAV
jgi:hypothetical protein